MNLRVKRGSCLLSNLIQPSIHTDMENKSIGERSRYLVVGLSNPKAIVIYHIE